MKRCGITRYLGICLAFVFVFCVFACRPPVSRDPNTLVWHLQAEPDLINPILSTDAYASRIEGFVFDTLIDRDPKTLKFRAKIAESWSWSSDRLSLIFTLKKTVTFHDGVPLTADDVVFSFERIQDPKVNSPHLRSYYDRVLKVEAIDTYTVRFVFKEPYFMALNIAGGIPILPRHLYSQDAETFNSSPINRAPVGSGPYRFQKWDTGKKITLTKNDAYYGAHPAISKIEFRIIPESSVALMVLKKGLLDLMTVRPIQWLRETQSPRFTTQYNKYQYYTPGYRFLAWNARRPQFNDARVRKAMTHFVNRQALIDKLEFGLGKMTSGPFFVLSPDYDASILPWPYDPVRGKALLEEAGWRDHDRDGILDKDGVPFRFTLLLKSGATFESRAATILKEDLAKAGIDLSIETMEWAVYLDRINKREFDAVMLGWSMGYDSDPYQVWHSSQAESGSNFVGFSNREADRLIEASRREFDDEKRQMIFHELHRIIHDEAPYTFMYCSPALLVLHNRFQNVNVYRGGLDPNEWVIQSESAARLE